MTASLVYNTAERPAACQGQLREQTCFHLWHNTVLLEIMLLWNASFEDLKMFYDAILSI